MKLAVLGAQTLLGRELIEALETRDCSTLPLATGPMTLQEEEGDPVAFAPDPDLLGGLDAVILADTPMDGGLLDVFRGRVLDLRSGGVAAGEPIPLSGTWPEGVERIKGRPINEQALALVPALVDGIEDISGVHLSSVACLGEPGILGLAAQSRAILDGREPDETPLGYRAAFEAIPLRPIGNFTEVRIPTFHGDIMIINLKGVLTKKAPPENAMWLDAPPTSREAAVTNQLLAHFAESPSGLSATLTLGFDPILWGLLQPTLRILGL